jgi:hypothetical protein
MLKYIPRTGDWGEPEFSQVSGPHRESGTWGCSGSGCPGRMYLPSRSPRDLNRRFSRALSSSLAGE